MGVDDLFRRRIVLRVTPTRGFLPASRMGSAALGFPSVPFRPGLLPLGCSLGKLRGSHGCSRPRPLDDLQVGRIQRHQRAPVVLVAAQLDRVTTTTFGRSVVPFGQPVLLSVTTYL